MYKRLPFIEWEEQCAEAAAAVDRRRYLHFYDVAERFAAIAPICGGGEV